SWFRAGLAPIASNRCGSRRFRQRGNSARLLQPPGGASAECHNHPFRCEDALCGSGPLVVTPRRVLPFPKAHAFLVQPYRPIAEPVRFCLAVCKAAALCAGTFQKVGHRSRIVAPTLDMDAPGLVYSLE